MHIEKANPQDADPIVKLYEKVWAEYKDHVRERFLQRLFETEENVKKQASKDPLFLVAREDDQIAGVIRGKVDFGGVAKISMLAVDIQWRGKKVGQELIKRFLQEIQNEECHSVYLYTHEALQPAITLYKKMGFAHKCFLENFWDHENFILMTLDMQQE